MGVTDLFMKFTLEFLDIEGDSLAAATFATGSNRRSLKSSLAMK